MAKKGFMNKLINNKYVLYFVLFVSLMNVLGYIQMNNYNSLITFTLISLLTSYFSKNMIVVLGTAVIITNLLLTNNYIREGMKSKKKNGKKSEEETSEATNEDASVVKETMSSKNKKTKKSKKSKEVQGFQKMNQPKSVPAPADESLEDEEIGKRIDYASTLEQAYDNLQGVLGQDGINGLTKETQQLIEQQKSLMGTMKHMGPMLKMAKETMSSFDMDGMKDTLGQISSMVSGMKK
jgi:uncharacterized membrane protein YciS (DUF1049 family)